MKLASVKVEEFREKIEEPSVQRMRSRSSDRLRLNFSPVDLGLHLRSSDYNQSIEFKLRNSSCNYSFERLINSSRNSRAPRFTKVEGSYLRSNKENRQGDDSLFMDSHLCGANLGNRLAQDQGKIREFDNASIGLK